MRATAEVSLQLCTLLEAQIGQRRVQDVGFLERRLVVMERQGDRALRHGSTPRFGTVLDVVQRLTMANDDYGWRHATDGSEGVARNYGPLA